MDDELENFTAPATPPPVKREYSEALLQAAIERLKARPESSKRFGCMQLAPPLFNDLCVRLLDRTQSVRETAEWLQGQDPDAPTRSSVERFSSALKQEYRLVLFSERRREAEGYLAEAAQGNPDAQQMILNKRLTELLTDELLGADDGESIDTKRLFALISGVRTVAQTAFDKQKMDARIEALEKLNLERDAAIKLKEQQLAERDLKLQADLEKRKQAVAAAEKAAAKGDSGEAVSKAVKEALGL